VAAPKERLKHVLEVAAGGEIAHEELARELCGILAEWPEGFGENTRVPFESLLEKVLGQLSEEARDRVARRFWCRCRSPASRPDKLQQTIQTGNRSFSLHAQAARRFFPRSRTLSACLRPFLTRSCAMGRDNPSQLRAKVHTCRGPPFRQWPCFHAARRAVRDCTKIFHFTIPYPSTARRGS